MFNFTKMHALGNDYVYVDAITQAGLIARLGNKIPDLAVRVSDRRQGIGSDGLIFIEPPTAGSGIATGAGVRMRIYNADGSEAEMCGNGIRCVAKYAVEHGLLTANKGEKSSNGNGNGIGNTDKSLLVETGAGVLKVRYAVEAGKVVGVTVDMGEPVLELNKIGVDVEQLVDTGVLAGKAGEVHKIRFAENWGKRKFDPPSEYDAIFVGMGNPHAVMYHPDVDAIALEHVGPVFEYHPAFYNRINVHFVQVINKNEVKIRTWERGSGITSACGTGASAVCVAGVLRRKTERTILAHMPGGDLHLEWKPTDHHVYMTGPAVEVFSGSWTAE